MKVVLATSSPKSSRDDDFNWATPGEVLGLAAFVCSTPEKREECGCGRAFSGTNSLKSTTYGVVAETDEQTLREQLRESSAVAEWSKRGDAFDAFWDELARISTVLVDDVPGTEVRVVVTADEFTVVKPETGIETTAARSADLRALIDAAFGARFEDQRREGDDGLVECGDHGRGHRAFVCAHLVEGEALGFNSDEPTEEDPWPDAWCDACDDVWVEASGWENVPEGWVNISIVCHRCYEQIRQRNLQEA